MTIHSAGPSTNQTSDHRFAPAIANLHAWLQTMRQPGGYGGPVAHWWQSRYQYTGPGLDWRYEGILIGYAELLRRDDQPRWRAALQLAASDLIVGQREDGTYPASRFELNPGVLGTPHEAAATLGLLHALPYLEDQAPAIRTAQQNLQSIVTQLWDERTQHFHDIPGVYGRVPNKLATLALAFLTYTEATGNEYFIPYAHAAMEDIVRYQMRGGALRGAIHQYDAGHGRGDGRFFPFYNARCIPALLRAGHFFADERYHAAARQVFQFLQRTMHADGSWPQIVYERGRRAEWPRWIAGQADVLLAFRALAEPIPEVALETLLAGQITSGGFKTARGFAGQILQTAPGVLPDFRDVTPVVGWNDKVFRLLAALLPHDTAIPTATVARHEEHVWVGARRAVYAETVDSMTFRTERGELLYRWDKTAPWADVHGAIANR